MSESGRNALIDAYFEAIDTADADVVRPVLAADFVYESPAGRIEGPDGFERYVDENRGLSNPAHDIEQRIHGEDRSAVEGTVTGETDAGTVEVDFCDVFGYDDAETRITRIAVYTNDA